MQEILLVVESVHHETQLEKEIIFKAVESALAAIAEKSFEEPGRARVEIDRETGEAASYRVRIVVADDWEEEIVDPEAEVEAGSEAEEVLTEGHIIRLKEAQDLDASLNIGDEVDEPIETESFSRKNAFQAKQVLVRVMREAERAKIARQYQSRIGEILTGQVKRLTRDQIIVELTDSVDAVMLRQHILPRENFRLGDRVRGYLYEIDTERRGPQLMLSRTHPNMLVELFRMEVPEINEDVLQIRAVARDPGSRAKIAVKTNDGRIDPIGACVGMRGSRVQAVSNELGGERMDIVLWDESPAKLVINAMSPAEVTSISMSEADQTMDIVVDEEQLSQAIGRAGQNVRLAGMLSGWELNVMSEAQAQERIAEEFGDDKANLMKNLEVDEDVADILIRENLNNIGEISEASLELLAQIEEFDEEIAEELQSRAKNALLTQMLAGDDELSTAEPAEDLLEIKGMTKELAYKLADQGIITKEDLADCAVDELTDIKGLGPKRAADFIMKARAHWFEDEESE